MEQGCTIYERWERRLADVEASMSRLGSPEALLNRMKQIEDRLYLDKEMLTVQEACTYCGITRGTMYNLTSQGRIPYSRPGGKKIYFRRKDLDEWLKQGHVPSVQSLVKAYEEKKVQRAIRKDHGTRQD